MAFDINEAREIIEAAKKRGLIRAEGEPPPAAAKTEAAKENPALPEWLQKSVSNPAAPEPFSPPVEDDRPRYHRDR